MVRSCYVLPRTVFGPTSQLITAITNATPAVVTTSQSHNYKDGLIVRLDIPLACGMQQADKLFAPILMLSATTFSIAINTTSFEPFSIPVSPPNYVDTCAQCVPIGEINSQLNQATQNIL